MTVVFIPLVALTTCLESVHLLKLWQWRGLCKTTLDMIILFVFFILNWLYLSLLLPVITRWGSPDSPIRPCHPPETYSLQYGEHIHSIKSICHSQYYLECMSSHNTNSLSFPLCCSTWAVWLLHAPWQTNWLLMWACRKTPQVAIKVFYVPHRLM